MIKIIRFLLDSLKITAYLYTIVKHKNKHNIMANISTQIGELAQQQRNNAKAIISLMDEKYYCQSSKIRRELTKKINAIHSEQEALSLKIANLRQSLTK